MKAIPTEKLILGAAVHDYPHSGIPDLLPSDSMGTIRISSDILRIPSNTRWCISSSGIIAEMCRKGRDNQINASDITCAHNNNY